MRNRTTGLASLYRGVTLESTVRESECNPECPIGVPGLRSPASLVDRLRHLP